MVAVGEYEIGFSGEFSMISVCFVPAMHGDGVQWITVGSGYDESSFSFSFIVNKIAKLISRVGFEMGQCYYPNREDPHTVGLVHQVN